jgi:membrane-bound lytic murein transglycosylase B
MKKLLLLLLLINSNIFAQTISAISLPQTHKFIDYMVDKHSFVAEELQFLFKNIHLTIKQPNQNQAKGKQIRKKTLWDNYQKMFLTDSRIDNGVLFMQTYKQELDKAYKKFGVSPYIITAILGIETNYGNYTGKYPTMQTLVALAFGKNRRQKFYLKELEEFLVMVRDNALPPLKLSGSHAGALGAAQFISSSYNHYAIDFNNDGKVDLFNLTDAIGSVANYFAKHYWQKDGGFLVATNANKLAKSSTNKPQKTAKNWRKYGVKINKNITDDIKLSFIKIPTKNGYDYFISFWNFYVITRYNHNNMYALATIKLADAIKNKAKL